MSEEHITKFYFPTGVPKLSHRKLTPYIYSLDLSTATIKYLPMCVSICVFVV